MDEECPKGFAFGSTCSLGSIRTYCIPLGITLIETCLCIPQGSVITIIRDSNTAPFGYINFNTDIPALLLSFSKCMALYCIEGVVIATF